MLVRTMEDRFESRCNDMRSSWGKKADGNKDHRGVKWIVLGQKGMLRTTPGYYFMECLSSTRLEK
ncbi:hypothetical protein YC2023_072740 [Brassica napus]